MRRRQFLAALGVAAVAPVVLSSKSASANPTVGAWTAPFALGGVAIHATLLRTDEILLFQDVEGTPGVDRSSRVRLWNYRTGATRDANLGYDRDLFCCSQSLLSDGRVYAAGGHETAAGLKQDPVGIPTTDIFDPVTRSWRPGPSMGEARWYPTNVLLGNGRTLTFGGQARPGVPSTTVDSYDPVTNAITRLPTSANKNLLQNPRMHLLPNGRIVRTGEAALTNLFDPATSRWTNGPQLKFGRRKWSMAVQLPGLTKVMQIGGAFDRASQATNTVEILDTSATTLSWRYTAPMAFRRILHTAVLLPDGKVLVIGGGATFKYTGPVRTPELFDPATETWSRMANQQAARMYHSTALLLPDGRVLSAGQDSGSLATTGEIFSPPYLFKGPRPTITEAPVQIGYGQQMTIASPEAAGIQSIALLKAGSMTHQIDTDQRYVPLSFTVSGTTLSASSPANGSVAPPGHYMLFLVDGQGVPSIATWVRLGS